MEWQSLLASMLCLTHTCSFGVSRKNAVIDSNISRVMEKGVIEKVSWIGVTETVRCAASWRRRRGKHGRHGKAVTECVMETARRAASWKGVTQSDTCGVSRNSRHGMRNG